MLPNKRDDRGRDKVPVNIGKTVARAVKQIGTISRKEMFTLVNSAFDQPDGSAMCVREANDREFLSEFFLSEMLGAGSINGEAHKICAPYRCTTTGTSGSSDESRNGCKCNKKAITLSVKLIPIKSIAWRSFEASRSTPHAASLIQYQDGQPPQKYELWVELTALSLANQLVLQHVCPNLPLMMRWFICKQCMYHNERLLARAADARYLPSEAFKLGMKVKDVQRLIANRGEGVLNPCAIVVNELANGGDLRKWLNGKKLSFLELRSMMFQITAGFYALGKYFNMRHYDAHLGNVLVHELPHKSGLYHYCIDGKNYSVPHYGRLFVIWDFGWARITDDAGGTILGAFKPERYATKAVNPTEDIRQVAALVRTWDKNYGIGATTGSSSSPAGSTSSTSDTIPYTMIFDENDTINGVANEDILLKLERSTSYADLFPSEFAPYFLDSTDGRTDQADTWDMDKPLKPFDDPDLEKLSRLKARPVGEWISQHSK